MEYWGLKEIIVDAISYAAAAAEYDLVAKLSELRKTIEQDEHDIRSLMGERDRLIKENKTLQKIVVEIAASTVNTGSIITTAISEAVSQAARCNGDCASCIFFDEDADPFGDE